MTWWSHQVSFRHIHIRWCNEAISWIRFVRMSFRCSLSRHSVISAKLFCNRFSKSSTSAFRSWTWSSASWKCLILVPTLVIDLGWLFRVMLFRFHPLRLPQSKNEPSCSICSPAAFRRLEVLLQAYRFGLALRVVEPSCSPNLVISLKWLSCHPYWVSPMDPPLHQYRCSAGSCASNNRFELDYRLLCIFQLWCFVFQFQLLPTESFEFYHFSGAVFRRMLKFADFCRLDFHSRFEMECRSLGIL